METNTGTIVGGVGIAMSVISMIYAAVNHKRVRAKCCGRVIEVELDVSSSAGTDQPHPKADADKRKTVKIHPRATSDDLEAGPTQ
jgi:hypothetical protein